MRNLLLVCLLSIAGCGNDATSQTDLSVAADLSTAADLSSMPDLSKSQLTCGGVITCLMGGGGAACLMRATPQATMKLQALVQCGINACALTGDAGPGECSGPTDTSQTCTQCALGVVQGGGCPTQLQACQTDHL